MIYYRLFSGYTSHEIGNLITSNVFNALCVTAEIVIFALLGIFLMWLIVNNISKIKIGFSIYFVWGVAIIYEMSDSYRMLFVNRAEQYSLLACIVIGILNPLIFFFYRNFCADMAERRAKVVEIMINIYADTLERIKIEKDKYPSDSPYIKNLETSKENVLYLILDFPPFDIPYKKYDYFNIEKVKLTKDEEKRLSEMPNNTGKHSYESGNGYKGISYFYTDRKHEYIKMYYLDRELEPNRESIDPLEELKNE